MSHYKPSPTTTTRRRFLKWAAAGCTTAFIGCDGPTGPILGDNGGNGRGGDSANCIIPQDHIHVGAARDAIPALTNPSLFPADNVDFLRAEERVVGVNLDDGPLAVPHKILNWHEIVNVETEDTDRRFAITYCPLTGSALVFDRDSVDGAEFGVSGLLYRNNLVMYDRRSDESLWPQMMLQAACGTERPAQLPTKPVKDMTWEGWKELHPFTRVVSDSTGHNRSYNINPYGNYGNVGNNQLYYSMPEGVDNRRPLKERVLGIPVGEGGVAFPFNELDNGEPARVIATTAGGQQVVIFWRRKWNTAVAFKIPDTGPTSFYTEGEIIRDGDTRSRWNLEGEAVEGSLAGRQLPQIADSYIAYWFAWAAFQKETRIWEDDSIDN